MEASSLMAGADVGVWNFAFAWDRLKLLHTACTSQLLTE